jgi:hypothetical protein
MAMCVMAVVGVAPCQCFSTGENQTTSPGRISSIGPPSRWTQPQPATTRLRSNLRIEAHDIYFEPPEVLLNFIYRLILISLKCSRIVLDLSEFQNQLVAIDLTPRRIRREGRRPHIK